MYLPRSLISHLYTNLLRTHHPLSAPVLILASLEPDALCACRILSALLKRDYIPHKIQPVSGYSDLAKVGNDLIKPMKTTEGGPGGVVVCLGVGGLVDLGDLLGLESEEEDQEPMGGVEVWVIDARRPWNLSNVFGGQPSPQALSELDSNARRKEPGVEKGCIQKSYRPGKGGIIVFDDGDIAEELDAERDAYCALLDMPEVEDLGDEDSDGDDEKENEDDSLPHNKKRKSWSDQENEALEGDDEERPRQRRRSNSGSSISSPSRRDRHTPSSSQSNSPTPESSSPKAPSAKALRRRLLALRRSHESVLDQYYTLGTSYSEPISSLLYSMASELGREDNDLLWLTIVGVSSLELSGHTSTGLGTSTPASILPHQYHQTWRSTRSSRIYALLRDEVRRLNPPPHDSSPSMSPNTSSASPTDTSIRLSPDPRFVLLRHWSLYDSMLHSPYLASRLHIWNESGVKRLHKLLARMGISLSQCKQGYTHMDMDLKKSLRDKLLKYAGAYGLDDLVPSGTGRAAYEQEGWGFIRSWGWKAQLNALDVGVIVGAILEVGPSHPAASSSDSNEYDGSSTQRTDATQEVEDRSEMLLPRFFSAYDALAPNHPTQLLTSIPLAQHLLRAILRTGTSLLAKHQIRHLRAFRMGVVKEGPDLGLFSSSPGALVKLALWVGQAVAVSERDKKGSDGATPLVLAALDEARGTYVVVGTGGGMGSGPDLEARKEKTEGQKKKQEEKEQRKKIREQKREAKAADKAVRELDGEDDDQEEKEEEESEEDSDDSSDDDEDEELKAKLEKRGYGRNRFGLAFQEVAEETNARVKIDSFDHCVIEVKREQLGVFLEGLSLKSVVGR